MTLTVSHQCPIPHAAEVCEANGPAQPSARAQATPHCHPQPGPIAVSDPRTARPTVAPIMPAQLLVLRCRTPLTRLSYLHHASRVGRRRRQASRFQGPVLGSDYPPAFLAPAYQVVDVHRRCQLRSTHLPLVTAHPCMGTSPLPRVRH